MVPQEKVQARANRVSELAISFERQVLTEVDSVVVEVSSHILQSLPTSQGIVRQSPKNSRKILAIEDVFHRAIRFSNYYPTILAFVESFADQADEFDALHEGTPISSDVLAADDRELLYDQTGAAVSVLEGLPTHVGQELRQLLSRSLGESELAELVSGTCAIVRKASRVEPMGRDQCNTWFRLLSSLVYRRIEGQGTKLTYSYAGAETKATREFCSKLLASGPLSLAEVSALDNGQTQDAFLNGGGYGCDHFWHGEVV